MNQRLPRSFFMAGMSLVGALVTLGILSIGVLALMKAQDQFSKTAQTVEFKESVIQEAASKAVVIQSNDFLKLEDTCRLYSLNGTEPGNCNNLTSSSTHPFLYRWYKADALTNLCLELTSCTKVASGKMLNVILTAYYETNGKMTMSTVSFRKAK
jgi:hypothetical protein